MPKQSEHTGITDFNQPLTVGIVAPSSLQMLEFSAGDIQGTHQGFRGPPGDPR